MNFVPQPRKAEGKGHLHCHGDDGPEDHHRCEYYAADKAFQDDQKAVTAGCAITSVHDAIPNSSSIATTAASTSLLSCDAAASASLAATVLRYA